MNKNLSIAFGKEAWQKVENTLSFNKMVFGSNGTLYTWDISYGGLLCKKIAPVFQNDNISYYLSPKKNFHLIVDRKQSEIICSFPSDIPELECYFHPHGHDFIIELSNSRYLFLYYRDGQYKIETAGTFPQKNQIRQEMENTYTPEAFAGWQPVNFWKDKTLSEKLDGFEDY